MSISIMQLLSWNLAEVATMARTLRDDSEHIESVGQNLFADSESFLDGMSGNSIDTALSISSDLRLRCLKTSDELDAAAEILNKFATETEVNQRVIRAERDYILSCQGDVDANGRVSTRPGATEREVTAGFASEEIIQSALHEVRRRDLETASALGEVFGSGPPMAPPAPNYADNHDTATSIASAIISGKASSTEALLTTAVEKSGDEVLGKAQFLKHYGAFGSLLGLAAGIAGAPQDEALSETLTAEVGGWAVGAVFTMAGAIAGSPLPVVGTAAGAVVGGIIGSGVASLVSQGVRDGYDNRRAETLEAEGFVP